MSELIGIAQPIVWRRGHRAGLTIEDREDLLQQILMKYLQAWPDADAPENVEAWVTTATANAITDRLRADARRPADNSAEGGEDPVAIAFAAMRSPQYASAPAVSQKIIDSVFALVPARDADLLRQRYIENASAAELADERGITVANIDQRTTRAKRKLRDALIARPDLVAELRAPHPHLY